MTDSAQRGRASIEQAVMAQVLAVAAELHPGRALPPGAGVDSLLDRDFALDSLGRVELAGRIEATLNVSLSEARIANADTPRDLVAAVEASSTGSTAAPAAPVPPAIGPPAAGERAANITLPVAARTLTQILDHHASESAGRVHIRLYDDDCENGGPGETLSFGRLRDGARQVAAGLLHSGLNPGEAVAIMLPTGRDYFFAFFGILYAGGVPVPIYPPARISQLSDHLRRHFGILANCRARVLIAADEMRAVAAMLKGGVETIRTVTTVAALSGKAEIPPLPTVSSGDVAFVQYTSGSTGQPKGVVLTHANLLANVRAMGRALRASDDDVLVSWLPLYHDMGLIGAWFGSLYHGLELVIMSPLRFLARPERWLRAIQRFGGTISASPNFGFELCVRRISDEKLAGMDLSSLRAVVNGAEPVSPETLERFIARFQGVGFKRTALMPVYGLAECSVGVTFPPLDRGPRVERINRETFGASGRAIPAGDDDVTVLKFVGCGRALPGHDIRVVDAAGHELPERHEGRLEFTGPSATSGYLHNAEETAKLMHGNWLDSGDMAYIADGEVFITGRAKDIIIRAGRNIYPQELEDAVGEIEGVRKGGVAVFAIPDAATGTERLVVLAETRRFDDSTRQRITRAIEALAVDLTQQPPDEIVLAPPSTVPKTSSGKIRRAASRDLFEKGLIGKPHAGAWLQVLQLSLLMARPTLRRAAAAIRSNLYAGYVLALAGALGTVVFAGLMVAPPGLRWPLARGLCRLLFAGAGIPVVVEGREHLPPAATPVVYVANHGSFIDGLILALAIGRPISFVAKRELQSHWLPRMILERLGTQFVERFDREQGMADARELTAAARRGAALVYFPEGTFISRAGILPFQIGAFSAAAESGAAVVAVAIRGARAILLGDSWFPRPGAIRVVIGRPLAADAAAGGTWQQALALRTAARGHILAHAGEPDMGGERAGKLA